MANLSDFQRGQIVDARMAGASVTETSRMLDVSRGTVSKVMTTFKREGKSPQQSTGQAESQSCLRETVGT